MNVVAVLIILLIFEWHVSKCVLSRYSYNMSSDILVILLDFIAIDQHVRKQNDEARISYCQHTKSKVWRQFSCILTI